MADATDEQAFHARRVAEFRANGGKLNPPLDVVPLLVLTTTGAKSGEARSTLMSYSAEGDRVIVVAANGGAETNPAWYHNLIANPEVTVEVGGETYQARAAVTAEPERTRLFELHATKRPNFRDFQAKTTRPLPVVVLERVGSVPTLRAHCWKGARPRPRRQTARNRRFSHSIAWHAPIPYHLGHCGDKFAYPRRWAQAIDTANSIDERRVPMDEAVRDALARDRTIDITTIGRQSGEARRIETWFHNIDGRIYLTGTPGKRDWYANLVANPSFTFHLKESAQADLSARATPITDPATRRAVFVTILDRLGRSKDLEAWEAGSPLVEVAFD